MAEYRMLTLIHEPIPEWAWPEMTMDFTAIDASRLFSANRRSTCSR